MIDHVVRELAARHALDELELIEVWSERAAIREYLGGDTRRGAELSALHEVEAMFQIGLHCPESRRLAIAGGNRRRPTGARPPVYTMPTGGSQ